MNGAIASQSLGHSGLRAFATEYGGPRPGAVRPDSIASTGGETRQGAVAAPGAAESPPREDRAVRASRP